MEANILHKATIRWEGAIGPGVRLQVTGPGLGIDQASAAVTLFLDQEGYRGRYWFASSVTAYMRDRSHSQDHPIEFTYEITDVSADRDYWDNWSRPINEEVLLHSRNYGSVIGC